MLEVARNVIELTVTAEQRARLMKGEWHRGILASVVNAKDPIVIADASLFSRFPACRDLGDQGFVKVAGKVDRTEQRLANNDTACNGKRKEDRKSLVGARLIFAGTAYRDVGVSPTPIGGKCLFQSLDPLGKKDEMQILPLSHHLPDVGSPFVGFLDQKIGRKAGVDRFARFDFPSIACFAQREQKIGIERDLGAFFSVLAVNAIDVAVLTALADTVTAVPRIPRDAHSLPFSTFSSLRKVSMSLNSR